MIKFVLFLTSLSTILHLSSSWTIIECNYKGNGDFHILKSIYFCSVGNNPLIYTEESAQVNSVNGEHSNSKSYDDVDGFQARQKVINYFPRGLHKYFKNLKVIYVYSCGLKEIRQSDLKVFAKLVYIFLESNYIEVIEEGLFDYNPNLQAVGLWEENIVHIDSKVFDNLSKLSCLWLSLTSCANKDAKDSKDKVKGLVNLVKNNCTHDDFKVQIDNLKILEIDLKNSNFDNSKEKLENFEKNFNSFKFLRFRPLSEQLEVLKNTKHSVIANNSIVLTSKLNLEPEKCPSFDSFYTNLTLAIKNKVDNIKTSIMDESDDKLAPLNEKLTKIDRKLTKLDEKLNNFQQKFENFEKMFALFEVRSAGKFDKIEMELTKSRNKIANLAEDVKGIEERLAKKFEEILEEKLGKVFQF